ncbi:MAG TPA: hypothetical protein VJS44_15520 [Pyrinomonadaceae bacterium]|nr:hypothetical protein [Pyrinomonadaceae bacterium]
MKTLERELKPVELKPDKWHAKVLDVELKDAEGNQFTYKGDALVSVPGENHSIKFEFHSSVFRQSELRLSVYASSDTAVRLYVNGYKLEPHEYSDGPDALTLRGAGQQTPVVRQIRQDVTRWVEGRDPSNVQLYFFCEDAQSTVTILTGAEQPEIKTALIQKWSWPYATQAGAFFGLVLLDSLGLLILASAHSRPLGEAFQYYAVITAILAWLLAFMGVAAKVRVSLWPTLRRLYGRTRNYRPLVLISLLVVFILVTAGVGVVTYSLRKRQQYSALINSAMSGSPEDGDESIRRAFALIPWRREAQILFERRAWERRNAADMAGFRQYVRDFVGRAEIVGAVESVKRNQAANKNRDLPFFLREEETTLGDPVVWYASLLPEIDEGRDLAGLNRAIELLSTYGTPEADMQRLSLELSLLTAQSDDPNLASAKGENERKAEEAADKLKNLLNQYGGKSESYSFAYQVGCDSLATYYVRLCHFKNKGFYQEAFNWFQKEIHLRSQVATLSKNRFWHRPPDKLVLYYMLCQECSTTGGGSERGKAFLRTYNYCYCFENELWKTEDPQCTFDWFKKQMEQYSEYQKRDAWFKNSILNTEVDSDIKNNLLKQGWRY